MLQRDGAGFLVHMQKRGDAACGAESVGVYEVWVLVGICGVEGERSDGEAPEVEGAGKRGGKVPDLGA